MAVLSCITPAYREAENLPVLYERLSAVLDGLGVEWEWIIVDDHSPDATFAVITGIAARDARVRGVRFARNFGSHAAIMCGLNLCESDAVVVLAADLQDPPETIPPLFEKWRQGAQVVWAVREHREGEKAATVWSARVYYWLMRSLAGIKEMPSQGADFFLLDRAVIQALRRFPESNVSMLALLTWMGFRQDSITYTKQARLYGTSGWTLRKKLTLAIDSITAFTVTPIRFMSYTGFLVATAGFLYALFVIVNALTGKPAEGWTSLIVVTLVVGGIQMLMLGVLGEYLWRTLDEARRRPRYLIESTTPLGTARGESAPN